MIYTYKVLIITTFSHVGTGVAVHTQVVEFKLDSDAEAAVKAIKSLRGMAANVGVTAHRIL